MLDDLGECRVGQCLNSLCPRILVVIAESDDIRFFLFDLGVLPLGAVAIHKEVVARFHRQVHVGVVDGPLAVIYH